MRIKSQVQMLYSVQVGTILSQCQKQRKEGGELVLAKVNSSVQAVLERLGLLKVIHRFDELDEAIKHLTKK